MERLQALHNQLLTSNYSGLDRYSVNAEFNRKYFTPEKSVTTNPLFPDLYLPSKNNNNKIIRSILTTFAFTKIRDILGLTYTDVMDLPYDEWSVIQDFINEHPNIFITDDITVEHTGDIEGSNGE